MLKSKCLRCKKRRKYGVELFFYRKSFFRTIKKYFICYACLPEGLVS